MCQAEGRGSIFQKLGQVLKEKARSDYQRVFKGTEKTRQRLSVVDELLTYWNIDEADDILEELEDALIVADFGPKSAFKLVDSLREEILAGHLKTGDDLKNALRSSIVDILVQRGGDASLHLPETGKQPAVIMVVGVNGGGKTTTIGKLSHRFICSGAKVMLGSGDTFRAAAFEQLCAWGERTGAVMGPYTEGSKPDRVLAATVQAAAEQDCDIVLCDTSGRLHTNWALMEELAKCERSIGKRQRGAPHEVLLVLDGSTGLNMMNQAREFSETVGVTGIILTKLDGSARGGAVVSVVDELGLPVKFVGVGETVDDLQPFDAVNFVSALFPAGDASLREMMEDVAV